MRYRGILNFMLVGILGIAVFAVTTNVSAATITVPGDYSTIQQAIDAAVDGDTILVSDGIYTGVGNKNLQWDGTVKHLTIMSANGPENCIIDCESSGKGFILDSGQDNTDVIDGFTIRNGLAAGAPPLNYGGAILCYDSSPIIQNCRIIDNVSVSDGGGIICANGGSPIIRKNYIANNVGGHTGGGIHVYLSAPIIENNIITGNTAAACYGGGGIACLQASSNTRIVGNLITNNTANHYDLVNQITVPGYGGGIICMNSGVLIANNTIVNNTTRYGADLGQGGGIRVGGGPVPIIKNCILWNNEGEPGHEELSRSAPNLPFIITYSNIDGGLTGIVPGWEATNIDSDPLFVGGSPFDYRLSTDSPCIDAGSPDTSGLNLPSLDLAGNPRINNEVIDMGAYENDLITLIASWPMDEGSGTTIYDTTSYSNNGTIYDATWTTGISGSALSFDGLDDYVRVNDDPAFDDVAESATVEFWFKRAGGFGDAQYILDKRTFCPGDSSFYFYCGMDNRLHGIYTGVSSDIVSTANRILDTNWHYAVFVYDSISTRLYLDGIFQDQEATTGSIVLDSGNINIGRPPCESAFFHGTIDEVRIWNHALTLEKIEKRFNQFVPAHNINTDEYFTSIQAAIDAANPGDNIEVARGIYNENIIIDKPLTLMGASSSTTIINGDGTGTMVRIAADNVKITGFTIQRGYNGILLDSTDNVLVFDNNLSINYVGIKITSSTNYEVNNNVFSSNTSANIFVDPSYDGSIVNNTITGSDIGIIVENSSPTIENNDIRGNNTGIYIESGSSIISGNVIIENSIGIHVLEGAAPIVQDNQIYDNEIDLNSSSQIINVYIQNLPDSAFDRKPSQRKKTLEKKLNAVDGQIQTGNYQGAINKLLHDIRPKMDGNGKPKDWIVNADAQADLCWLIDALIAYIKTLF